MTTWETRRILITGKAYPHPSETYIETVCTGGITQEGDLIRLYPVSYRYLDKRQQYRKWSWIEASVKKINPKHDPRLESHRVDEKSIQIISEASENEKLRYMLSAESENHDELDAHYQSNAYGSMGIIRISPIDLIAQEADPQWSEKHEQMLRQYNLFSGKTPKEIEKPEYELRLEFQCWNPCSTCAKKPHKKKLLTWDVYEGYRNFRDKYGGSEKGLEHLQSVFWSVFSGKKYCMLLLGTHSRHHSSWMIGGYYCPTIDSVDKHKNKEKQIKLFD